MFNKLLELYKQDRLSDAGLDRAVDKGWITPEQAEEIKTEVRKDG